jgi:hypothetical protein
VIGDAGLRLYANTGTLKAVTITVLDIYEGQGEKSA